MTDQDDRLTPTDNSGEAGAPALPQDADWRPDEPDDDEPDGDAPDDDQGGSDE
jgi:hypothetical protein